MATNANNASMPKKRDATDRITAAVRVAIENSGLTRYEIAKATGIEQSALSRFMSGERGLTTASLDRLAPLLGLEIVAKSRKRS